MNQERDGQSVRYQLGFDTGGTYTDAVVVDERQSILASAKSLTTHGNLIEGLRCALDEVLVGVSPEAVQLACLSTTLATNALVEGRGRSVAMILIGFSSEQMKRANLADALGGDPCVFVDGGHDATGMPIQLLDIATCRQFVQRVESQVDAYTVSGVFSVRNPEHEQAVKRLIERLTTKPVSCGHQLSSDLDAPRRALTALLNARLIPMITALIHAARDLLRQNQISAPLMIVRGDGSLVSDEFAQRSPVETILSGPAASVVGACFLSRRSHMLVSDMGGTTTDIAVIENHEPVLNHDGATVGGWRTMVKAVDVQTHGLGGDSSIVFDLKTRQFEVGPRRVMPLSLLARQFPETIDQLQAQCSQGYSTTHSAQFALAVAESARGLTYRQSQLFERIGREPVALQSLFSDQTLENALLALEQKGLVLRAGFTPTDACHMLNLQTDWNIHASQLGARLLVRYAADNHGRVFESDEEFAETIRQRVSQLAALALVDAASGRQLGSQSGSQGLSDSQRKLIESSFPGSYPLERGDALVSVQAKLHAPIAALGAPSQSYYADTAQLLATDLIIPEHGSVANALGAVVGLIRQQVLITIQPAGGNRVNVLFPEGAKEFESLEYGAHAATEHAEQHALENARCAGAADPVVKSYRQDNIVKQGDEQVFFESTITAVASGRPALG
ncbi:MAG: hydantoinase/oxoprolinase family protein [Granulosicoccus sp.]|nr:hydantoinase/oxoprolinase family protein [Granulosicoccus sp.]